MVIQRRKLVGPFPENVLLGPAIRYADQLVIGGQKYNFEGDERAWIESRLKWHPTATYRGYWSFEGAPFRACAGRLSIVGGDYVSINGGLIDGVKVPEGAPLAADWILQFSGTASVGLWESVLKDAATGEVVDSQETSAQNVTLPALAAGSYLWHVRVKQGQKTYNWPPPAYEDVTGRSATDPAYKWVSPIYGVVYYNPIWNVGLYPPAGHKLDILRRQIVAAGTFKKNPDWIDYVAFTDEDGHIETAGGEYASLRVIAGAGSVGGDVFGWIGDAHVPEAATAAGACLWLAPTEGAAIEDVTPWIIDPTARICGALYVEPADTIGQIGALWIGLHVAGRDGRTVRLIAVEAAALEDVTKSGEHVLESAFRACECDLSNEAPNSVRRWPDRPLSDGGGAIQALTFCSRLTYRPNEADPARRVVEDHPGGRGLSLTRAAGGGALVWATESDFATSKRLEFNFNYLLSFNGREKIVTAGSAHHVYDCVADWNGAAYFVEEVKDIQAAIKRQYLTRHDGATGQRLAQWNAARYDMAQLSAAGPNLVIFGDGAGVPDFTMEPIAFQFTGGFIQPSASFNYWPRRVGPSLSVDGKREVCLGTGYKVDPTSDEGDAVPLAGMFVFETFGEETVTAFCYDDGAFCASTDALRRAGYAPADLPPFLVYDEASAAPCWKAASEAPEAGFYLVLETSDETVCYVLPEGVSVADLPYDADALPCLLMLEPESCFTPTSFPPDPPTPDPTDPRGWPPDVPNPFPPFCFDDETGDNGGFCGDEDQLRELGYEPEDLPPFLVWNAPDCWKPETSAPDAGFYLELDLSGGVCYLIPDGFTVADLPYDPTVYNCFYMIAPDACFIPDGPTPPDCDRVSDCYPNFPAGSVLYAIELQIDGDRVAPPLLTVKPFAKSRSGFNPIGDVGALARRFPGWLWLGGDVVLPDDFVSGVAPTDEVLAALDDLFPTKATVFKASNLQKPARFNAMLLAIVPPNAALDFALSPS